MSASGYISELGYTHGFYSELAPANLRLAMLSAGIDVTMPADPSYLELGFGQGLTLNIVAATNKGRYWGTDFNPAHAANARALGEISGADVRILDDAFDELAARADLPEFDIIALHGIWSWISDANRAVIVDIARRKLRPGGLFYVSYNVTPGWSPAMPLRHLMVEYSRAEARGEIMQKVDQSLAFAQRLVDSGASYFANNPAVVGRLERLHQQDRHYLAHEFFNEDWHPMPFSVASKTLEPAKLSFAASAGLIDHIAHLNLSPDAQDLIDSLSDARLRETTRDYFTNSQFRRDIFVKGPRPLSRIDREAAIRDAAFLLIQHPDDVPAKVLGSLGEADMRPEIFGPVIAALDVADAGLSVGAICAASGCADLSLDQIWEAVLVLSAIGSVAALPTHAPDAEAAGRAGRLNRELCRRAAASGEIGFLASPVTGGALSVGRISQMFLHAHALGEEPVDYVWSTLSGLGERMIRDGEILQDDSENLAFLRDMHERFETRELPILRRVGIAG
jgi:SAM-dependent methyltransferase